MASNKFVAELVRTEGAPTPEKILAEIQEGLLEYLNNYEVIHIRHSRDRRVSSGEYTAMNGVIEVSRKPEIRIVPDLTGSQLVYKQILDLNYTMFLCVSSEKNGIRILYHWQARGRHFMTSPYFDSKARRSVLCNKPVDITDGVNVVRPVAAVRKMLEEIGYRYDQFL